METSARDHQVATDPAKTEVTETQATAAQDALWQQAEESTGAAIAADAAVQPQADVQAAESQAATTPQTDGRPLSPRSQAEAARLQSTINLGIGSAIIQARLQPDQIEGLIKAKDLIGQLLPTRDTEEAFSVLTDLLAEYEESPRVDITHETLANFGSLYDVNFTPLTSGDGYSVMVVQKFQPITETV